MHQQRNPPAVASPGQIYQAAPPPCHVGKREFGPAARPFVRPIRRLVRLCLETPPKLCRRTTCMRVRVERRHTKRKRKRVSEREREGKNKIMWKKYKRERVNITEGYACGCESVRIFQLKTRIILPQHTHLKKAWVFLRHLGVNFPNGVASNVASPAALHWPLRSLGARCSHLV